LSENEEAAVRNVLWMVAALALATSAGAAQEKAQPSCKGCGKETYGTSVKWVGSPSEAAKKAKEKGKLVFVLHVSGYFEDPKFT
jgi:hypothetical protein